MIHIVVLLCKIMTFFSQEFSSVLDFLFGGVWIQSAAGVSVGVWSGGGLVFVLCSWSRSSFRARYVPMLSTICFLIWLQSLAHPLLVPSLPAPGEWMHGRGHGHVMLLLSSLLTPLPSSLSLLYIWTHFPLIWLPSFLPTPVECTHRHTSL